VSLPPIDVADAVSVLARIVEAEGPDDYAVHAHLVAARASDALVDLGCPVEAERLVPALGSLADAELEVIGLMVGLVEGCESVGEALRERLSGAGADPVQDELTVREVLIGPARAFGGYLTADVLSLNDFRREELVRGWAAKLGAPIRKGKHVEKPGKAARQLERLDYRRIQADEERFRIEQEVLAEHARKVRELQERRERAAMAAASRE